jgi:hypothetical protein
MKFEVANNVPTMASDPTLLENPPVNPDPVGGSQVYVTPSGIRLPFCPFVGVYAKGAPLHDANEKLLIMIEGLTRMDTVKGLPAPQFVVLGSTVYTAV